MRDTATPRKKIGVLGGTFDPIHYGHLHVAQTLYDTYALDQVRLIPAAIPPHRANPVRSAHERLKMLTLALNGMPHLVADDSEMLREGKSYTIDTLTALQRSHPEADIVWALGTDSFAHFSGWQAWQALLDVAHLAIVVRPGMEKENWYKDLPFALKQQYDARVSLQNTRPYQILPGKISLLPAIALSISATHLRDRLLRQVSARFFTPDSVVNYINKHGLYK